MKKWDVENEEIPRYLIHAFKQIESQNINDSSIKDMIIGIKNKLDTEENESSPICNNEDEDKDTSPICNNEDEDKFNKLSKRLDDMNIKYNELQKKIAKQKKTKKKNKKKKRSNNIPKPLAVFKPLRNSDKQEADDEDDDVNMDEDKDEAENFDMNDLDTDDFDMDDVNTDEDECELIKYTDSCIRKFKKNKLVQMVEEFCSHRKISPNTRNKTLQTWLIQKKHQIINEKLRVPAKKKVTIKKEIEYECNIKEFADLDLEDLENMDDKADRDVLRKYAEIIMNSEANICDKFNVSFKNKVNRWLPSKSIRKNLILLKHQMNVKPYLFF